MFQRPKWLTYLDFWAGGTSNGNYRQADLITAAGHFYQPSKSDSFRYTEGGQKIWPRFDPSIFF